MASYAFFVRVNDSQDRAFLVALDTTTGDELAELELPYGSHIHVPYAVGPDGSVAGVEIGLGTATVTLWRATFDGTTFASTTTSVAGPLAESGDRLVLVDWTGSELLLLTNGFPEVSWAIRYAWDGQQDSVATRSATAQAYPWAGDPRLDYTRLPLARRLTRTRWVLAAGLRMTTVPQTQLGMEVIDVAGGTLVRDVASSWSEVIDTSGSDGLASYRPLPVRLTDDSFVLVESNDFVWPYRMDVRRVSLAGSSLTVEASFSLDEDAMALPSHTERNSYEVMQDVVALDASRVLVLRLGQGDDPDYWHTQSAQVIDVVAQTWSTGSQFAVVDSQTADYGIQDSLFSFGYGPILVPIAGGAIYVSFRAPQDDPAAEDVVAFLTTTGLAVTRQSLVTHPVGPDWNLYHYGWDTITLETEPPPPPPPGTYVAGELVAGSRSQDVAFRRVRR